MVIFHSYVSLPEGKNHDKTIFRQQRAIINHGEMAEKLAWASSQVRHDFFSAALVPVLFEPVSKQRSQ